MRRPYHLRQQQVEAGGGLLGFGGWLQSLRSPLRVNDLAWREDPGYAWHMLTRRPRKALRRAGRRLSAAVGARREL